MYEDVLS